jgi:hypothetical protein
MKFAFLIPLRNRAMAKNWEVCVDLCLATMRSATQQTASADDFQVVLVCRDFPEVSIESHVKILRGSFPDPEPTWEAQHRDKYAKIRFGLDYLADFAPLYVMKLDADDLVSNKIVSYVLADDNQHGYYVENGFHWISGRKWVEPIGNFHVGCGSSNILYVKKCDFEKNKIQESKILKLGHNITVKYFHDMNQPLKAIPFQGVIYRKQNGENITSYFAPNLSINNKPNIKFYLGKYWNWIFRQRKYLSRTTKNEFGII